MNAHWAGLLALTLGLGGCGSKFENAYTESCAQEGKYSKQRCRCVAGILDKSLSAEQKQLVLNPGDISLNNMGAAFSLIKPSLEALDLCKQP